MKVAVGLRRVAAGKRTSGRRAAQIAASAGFEELCLIFPEAQRFIWHAGLPISAKAILAWLRSSN